jgi:hypothetical protein
MADCTTVKPDGPAWHATFVFGVFLSAQALDGLLTYWGVSLLGIGVEANVLVAHAIETLGASWALLGAKLLACVCGYILYRTAFHRPLAIMAGLYVGVAVVPWLMIAGMLLLAP